MNFLQRFVLFFKKDSPPGLRRFAPDPVNVSSFSSKKIHDWDCVAYAHYPVNVSSFSSKKIHDWDCVALASSFSSKRTCPRDCVASLLIPFLAKNSRLGYFLNANNPQGGSYSS
jgi:hypothetical protein